MQELLLLSDTVVGAVDSPTVNTQEHCCFVRYLFVLFVFMNILYIEYLCFERKLSLSVNKCILLVNCWVKRSLPCASRPQSRKQSKDGWESDWNQWSRRPRSQSSIRSMCSQHDCRLQWFKIGTCWVCVPAANTQLIFALGQPSRLILSLDLWQICFITLFNLGVLRGGRGWCRWRFVCLET